ncbi:MAG: helix-turn-helix transcriptional regulator [Nanoarchaeota archaeon]
MASKLEIKARELDDQETSTLDSAIKISQKTGINPGTAIMYIFAKRNGFGSRTEYNKHFAKRNGFGSYTEYREHLASERQKLSEYKNLAKLIKDRLKEVGQNQSWLASEIGVTRQCVSYYLQAKDFPGEEKLKTISQVLNIPYGKIEEAMAS